MLCAIALKTYQVRKTITLTVQVCQARQGVADAAIVTFLSRARGLSLTKASWPSSSTVCALSFSSVSPQANGTPGLLISSYSTSTGRVTELATTHYPAMPQVVFCSHTEADALLSNTKSTGHQVVTSRLLALHGLLLELGLPLCR